MPDNTVHLFVSAGDVVDGHGSKRLQRSPGYFCPEGIERQGEVRQFSPQSPESGFQPRPFFLFARRSTTRSGGAASDVQYIRSLGNSAMRPLDNPM